MPIPTVQASAAGMFKCRKNVNNFENWDPERRQGAAMKRLPRGNLLWSGFELHFISCPWRHSEWICSMDPNNFVFIDMIGAMNMKFINMKFSLFAFYI